MLFSTFWPSIANCEINARNVFWDRALTLERLLSETRSTKALYLDFPEGFIGKGLTLAIFFKALGL